MLISRSEARDILNNKSFMQFFSREEVACNCGCGQDTGDWVTAEIMDDLHRHYDKIFGRVYIFVESWNRCVEYNEAVQLFANPDYIPFSSKSLHMKGLAVDFKIYYRKDNKKIYISTRDIYDYLCKRYPTKFGFICYPNFNHIDSRSNGLRKVI